MTDDLTTLTDDEARDLLGRVYAEVQRRDAIAQAPAQAEALATAYAAAIGRKPGDPYQPVVGAHDAYAPGSIVSADGDYYRSTAWASHPPGTQGAPWERVWPDGDGWASTPPVDPETGQPDWPAWDSTVTYRRSADQVVKVTHKGHLWNLVHDNAIAGWEPGGAGMHDVWADEGPIA